MKYCTASRPLKHFLGDAAPREERGVVVVRDRGVVVVWDRGVVRISGDVRGERDEDFREKLTA